jgi:hypothetical protein
MVSMNQKLILFPVFALFALTFIVLFWMGYLRLSKISRSRINPQILADQDTEAKFFCELVNPSDNFENLFEMPVIFYVVVILIFLLQLADPLYLYAAWIYVTLRYAHSFIHCTSNHVNSRFVAYMLSALLLLAICARLLVQVIE